MIEEKVYPEWAFSENREEKRDMNTKIFKRLEKNLKFKRYNEDLTDDDLKNYTCIDSAGRGHGHKKYKILSNPFNLKESELALLCDSGNLCFGYEKDGNIIKIYTD